MVLVDKKNAISLKELDCMAEKMFDHLVKAKKFSTKAFEGRRNYSASQNSMQKTNLIAERFVACMKSSGFFCV